MKPLCVAYLLLSACCVYGSYGSSFKAHRQPPVAKPRRSAINTDKRMAPPLPRGGRGGDDCNANPWPADRQNNRLSFGDTLLVGSYLESKNSRLAMHANGQLVLTQKASGAVMWSSPAAAGGVTPLGATIDGSGLTLIGTNNLPYWNAGGRNVTGVPSTTTLVLVDSCDLVLFSAPPFDTPLWSSGTGYCLDVHVVPHSHDDVGWILTPERYYDGCYDPQGGVQSIIRTMVEALYADPSRTFVQVEQYFFHRWWTRQNAAMREKARTVIKRGQFIFINGGWVMHDEACVHHESVINNMARGAQFLRDEFGYDANLTVGWHLDPFGHASATPRLMAQMGFNSFWFQRVDHQHKQQMISTRTLESMWDASPSLGDPHYMFTSIMVDGYCKGCEGDMCPSGFCCFTCEDAVGRPTWTHEMMAAKRAMAPQTDAQKLRRLFKLQGDQPLNLGAMADAVAENYRQYATNFRTDQLLVPWGCDFMHIDAAASFGLMDAIMAEIKANPKYSGMNLFYSHPQRYTDALIKEGYTWPTNKHDYFLDSDDGHSYWSGYFSSRAEFKRWERVLMHQMGAADMLLSTLSPDSSTFTERWNKIDALRQAMGVAQHHDSITGTERQSVCNQYQKILHLGSEASAEAEGSMIEEMTGYESPSVCALANLSACVYTAPLVLGKPVTVILYSAVAWDRTELVTVPVPIKTVSVFANADGAQLAAQTQDTWEMTTTADPTSPPVTPYPYELLFQVTAKALGYTVLTIKPTGNTYVSTMPITGRHVLANTHVSATIDALRGLVDLTNLADGATTPVTHNYYWYCPMNSTNGQQASGAYILRPCTPDATPTALAPTFERTAVVAGPLCTEVRSIVDSRNKVHQTIRLCAGDEYLSVQTGIGEIDAGAVGKEVVMKMSTNIESNRTWYSDGQGLEMEQRVRDSRPNYPYTVTEPVAGNFFPSNVWSYITSPASGKSLAVVSDVTRGAASLRDGELEFLIIRRDLYDDSRGVDQPLNESIRLITTSRLYLGKSLPAVVTKARAAGITHTHPLNTYYSLNSDYPQSDKKQQEAAVSEHVKRLRMSRLANSAGSSSSSSNNNERLLAAAALPPNVHLHTRQMVNPTTVLVRLQHIYAAGESPLATAVTVDLQTVLPSSILGTATITNIVEMDLNGVNSLDEVNRMRTQYLTCSVDGARRSMQPANFVPSLLKKSDEEDATTATTSVTLNPMDIRTYQITLSWN